SPVLINLPAGSSTTTELLAVGGKQGNGYLADAGNHLNNPTPNPNNSPAPYPAGLTSRPPVVSPNQDPSLYDPNAIRPYFHPRPAARALPASQRAQRLGQHRQGARHPGDVHRARRHPLRDLGRLEQGRRGLGDPRGTVAVPHQGRRLPGTARLPADRGLEHAG